MPLNLDFLFPSEQSLYLTVWLTQELDFVRPSAPRDNLGSLA